LEKLEAKNRTKQKPIIEGAKEEKKRKLWRIFIMSKEFKLV